MEPYITIYADDLKPEFCHVCGKNVEEKFMHEGFDIYTGKEVMGSYLTCPSLNMVHSRWKLILDKKNPKFEQFYEGVCRLAPEG